MSELEDFYNPVQQLLPFNASETDHTKARNHGQDTSLLGH